MAWQDPYGESDWRDAYGRYGPHGQDAHSPYGPEPQDTPPPGYQPYDPYAQGPYSYAQDPYAQYGYAPPLPPTPARNPGLAVAALVANIVCALFCCGIGLAWLPGVILSVFALNKSTAPETARKLTIGAWVCFWLNIVLTVVALMLLWVFGSRPTGTY